VGVQNIAARSYDVLVCGLFQISIRKGRL
jgi:hypothetical protein